MMAATFVRVGRFKPPAAELNAVGFCPAQTGHDALADHRAFEFGKHAQHLEHGPAGRRRRVEPLLMQEQVDALGVEFAEEVQQVDQRAAQAIDRPGRDHVDVTTGNGLEQAIEARPLVAAFGARDTGVLEKLDEAPVMALRSALLRTCRPPRRSAPAANAFNPAIKSDVLGMTVLLWRDASILVAAVGAVLFGAR